MTEKEDKLKEWYEKLDKLLMRDFPNDSNIVESVKKWEEETKQYLEQLRNKPSRIDDLENSIIIIQKTVIAYGEAIKNIHQRLNEWEAKQFVKEHSNG